MGDITWDYTYNVDGLRTSKSNGTTTYNYTYTGDKLTCMTVGDNTLYFAYDASGVPMSVTYNDVTYYYVTNVQGDVIALVNSSGAEVATYAYDAWGNPIDIPNAPTSEVGTLNPLRYRGYVYDQETGLYYLQSRYYNPELGRFINADGLVTTGQGLLGNNMFAYCLNNPINIMDPFGESPIAIGIGIVVAVVAVVAILVHPVVKKTSEVLGSAIANGLPRSKEDVLQTFAVAIAIQAAEVYAYSKAVAETLKDASERIPHVHHIVPAGNFSNRSYETVNKINQMHEKLASVGINRFVDPMNLVLVSAKTHARLHTDAYIDHVHSYIMSAGNTKEDVYAALFYLRLEIAAWDVNALGY